MIQFKNSIGLIYKFSCRKNRIFEFSVSILAFKLEIIQNDMGSLQTDGQTTIDDYFIEH